MAGIITVIRNNGSVFMMSFARFVRIRPVNSKIKDIVYGFKQQAVKRRNYDLAVAHGVVKRKVIEVLSKAANNKYKCPGCGKQFKPQGITGHVKACAKSWCKNDNIK